jgi:hypothetical protein
LFWCKLCGLTGMCVMWCDLQGVPSLSGFLVGFLVGLKVF